jgi:dimeric dUTPase (all-alpha-NTP-PPase superfamily)
MSAVVLELSDVKIPDSVTSIKLVERLHVVFIQNARNLKADRVNETKQ